MDWTSLRRLRLLFLIALVSFIQCCEEGVNVVETTRIRGYAPNNGVERSFEITMKYRMEAERQFGGLECASIGGFPPGVFHRPQCRAAPVSDCLTPTVFIPYPVQYLITFFVFCGRQGVVVIYP
ncbi:hypothetical protein V8F20_003735 [Naviculisporaceae sp. PSN 640]